MLCSQTPSHSLWDLCIDFYLFTSLIIYIKNPFVSQTWIMYPSLQKQHFLVFHSIFSPNRQNNEIKNQVFQGRFCFSSSEDNAKTIGRIRASPKQLECVSMHFWVSARASAVSRSWIIFFFFYGGHVSLFVNLLRSKNPSSVEANKCNSCPAIGMIDKALTLIYLSLSSSSTCSSGRVSAT